jgi:hypothetical protein
MVFTLLMPLFDSPAGSPLVPSADSPAGLPIGSSGMPVPPGFSLSSSSAMPSLYLANIPLPSVTVSEI